MVFPKALTIFLIVDLLANGTLGNDTDLQRELLTTMKELKIAMETNSLLLAMSLSQNGMGQNKSVQELLTSVMKDSRTANAACNNTLPVNDAVKGRDCADIWNSGVRTNGIYDVEPRGVESFKVYCDMTTDGGGWTIFQRRGNYGNPEDYFTRTWDKYKNGFGDLNKEFWLGNEKIYALTNQGSYELRIEVVDMNLTAASAVYSFFRIENEDQSYKLNLSGYSGDAGDSLSSNSGMPFGTGDHKSGLQICNSDYRGAWWYNSCWSQNLNGLNLRDGPESSDESGIVWETFREWHSLDSSRMMIRPSAER